MSLAPEISRRRFVRVFAILTAASLAKAHRSVAKVIAEAEPAGSDAGWLQLQLSDFPALLEDFGSVRIGTSALGDDHRPLGLFYPVIITRGPGGSFYALDSACSHEGCTVPIYDPEAGLLECPCHGSQYLIDGTVRRGPANFPLRQFATRLEGTNRLWVAMPDVSFDLKVRLASEAQGRLLLEFDAFEQIEYEIHFRPTATADWSGPVAFALTAEGPVTQTSFVGQANIASVYLEDNTSSGFFAVAMRTKAV